MALLTLDELRGLVDRSKDWEAEGLLSARQTLGIELPKRNGTVSLGTAEASKKRTITYEGRDVTLVLDFDDHGFLISLELV